MFQKKLFVIAFALLVSAGVCFSGSAVLAQVPDLGVTYPAAAGLSDLDPRITTARIIRIALSLLGTIFLAIVLYGGFLWMTAGGNDEKIGEAKSWIYSGVVGLAIILSAYGVTTFVLRNLVAATV